MLKEIDPFLARPFCYGAKAFRSVLCRKAVTGTLVIRPGGMGDLVAAIMALEWMGIPFRDIDWLIESRSRPWAEYLGLKHYCYDVNPLQISRQLWGRFSTVINTEQLFGLSQAYALLCADRNGNIWKFSTNRGLSLEDNHSVSYDSRTSHEVVEFAKLFSQALCKPFPSHPLERPRLRKASQPPVIAIAGRQSKTRSFTAQEWRLYCEKWLGDRPCVVVSSPQDRVFATELTGLLGSRARLFSGSFKEVCEQIADSEEVFTVDGGMVHVASYFGVKTVALFTSGNDAKWKPLAEGSAMWRRSDLQCQPCVKFGQVPPCQHEFACKKIPIP